MKKILFTLLILTITLTPALLGGCSSAQTLTPGQTVEVKRGDINIVVTSEGKLEMPNEFDLKFGTTGQVEQILVEEGDIVKRGALLAMLDNSSQINAIESALFSIETSKNNITFVCDTDHLPYYYPDLSIPRMMEEAQKDIDAALSYYNEGNYKEAGYNLIQAYFDVEVCEDLISTRPNAAVLAGAKTNSLWSPDIFAGSSEALSPDYAAIIDYLKNYRETLLTVSGYMKTGDYAKAGPAFNTARGEMMVAAEKANSAVYLKDRQTFKYPDTQTSGEFLQASMRYLEDLQQYIASGEAIPIEAAKRLYTAKLNLAVGSDVLQNQTLIFESGGSIGWKTLQQYNLSLQSAEVALYKAKQQIMQTAIITPSDGTVVAVDLKKSYVLSSQDYSSRTAVQLVDTNTIRFTGTVDEIDIMKVKQGQKASITIDAISGKVLTGTVQFISPYGAKSGNVIKFNVHIKLDPTDAPLKGGLTSTAEIKISSATNALLVPLSVIISTPGGSMITVVKSDGTTEMRRVTIGLQNFEYAEVKSGLSEGEKVQVVTTQTLGTKTTTSRGGAMGALR
ncbi:MAG: efflux RND transporter periplasmic adaptor subunit [Chloroflexi bacterium]|nr:efflux RND transporter periplasmic adaptor subunit [Chloroflexota bacterium]